jgi:hypothetical protein
MNLSEKKLLKPLWNIAPMFYSNPIDYLVYRRMLESNHHIKGFHCKKFGYRLRNRKDYNIIKDNVCC